MIRSTSSTAVMPANWAAPAGQPMAPPLDPYDPDVLQSRLEAGRRAELTADELPKDLVGRPAPTYFRTYEQLKGVMFELQAKYPELVEVRDIGDTWEKTQGEADRDVLALVLTNRTKDGAKPSTMHVGGIHAREIANPELLMTFATQLLTGYGRDAEATMLLDSRETVLVPMLNADGHALVEKAFSGEKGGDLMKRKNTSGDDGVDLNRNYEFHWGGAGAELVLDAAAAPGSGVALTAADGAFDEVDEQVAGDAAKLPGIAPEAGDGTLVYVRGRDAQGNWGPLAAQWLTGPALDAAR